MPAGFVAPARQRQRDAGAALAELLDAEAGGEIAVRGEKGLRKQKAKNYKEDTEFTVHVKFAPGLLCDAAGASTRT
jgi:hypothetical protein